MLATNLVAIACIQLSRDKEAKEKFRLIFLESFATQIEKISAHTSKGSILLLVLVNALSTISVE